MPDIINLLPDSIANQIAAGEVIQRPASVVKELVENSLDAGATRIQIIIKDAGRTLIQVIDNGKGMSLTDARMAFERHATSKIKNAEDLFKLTTMGFRGEALPSIAAISQIELRTKLPEDETGTLIVISGSKVEKQEVISYNEGTSIAVKNIFFNVPARRKFLKSPEVERRNILTEIKRIVLVNPNVEFTLTDNDLQSLYLPSTGLRQRIIQFEGKNLNNELLKIEENTSIGKIYGYISTPESAKKKKANQFFFVNNRYVRYAYLHKAVMTVYAPLIGDRNPNYYIYFDVDPSIIDVNIHPTKTEIKFEDEQMLWHILVAVIKGGLGKSNEVPSIDFDTQDAPDIPIFDSKKTIVPPKVSINPNYTPLGIQTKKEHHSSAPAFNWEELYKGFEKEKVKEDESVSKTLFPEHDKDSASDIQPQKSERPAINEALEHYQYKQRYILTSVKSGLMFIDQHRAHLRILFERYLNQIKNRKCVTQKLLYQETLDLTAIETSGLSDIMDDVTALGFELVDNGNNSFIITGIPSNIDNIDFVSVIRSMIESRLELGKDVKEEIRESIALSMAKATAIPYGRFLSPEEMLIIVNQLFACQYTNYTPSGSKIITVVSDDEIGAFFKRQR